MKIKMIKKRCCTAITGGLLAILPMFFLLSVVNTELNAQQIDRPYTDATMSIAIETIKSEMIKLRLEMRNQGGSDENYLLLEYYPAVISKVGSSETFEDAFISSLNVFFNSHYSNRRSNLHISIFGTPEASDPSSGDPSSPYSLTLTSSSPFPGTVEPEFKQLIDAIESTEGHPSTFQALFNFMNNNK